MIEVKLYHTKTPKVSFTKSLTSIGTYSCALKENTSVSDPTIIIQTDDNIFNANYMEIETFGRKYFIKDKVSIGNNRYEIPAHVDVLSSFKSGILANSAVIRRQQNIYNLYLDDPDFQVYNYEVIKCIQFSPSADFSKTLQYVIVTDNKPSAAAKKEEEGGSDNVK